MLSDYLLDSIPLSTLISIVLKSVIESIICLCTIVINVLLIASLLRLKYFRITQNLLLINVCFACILFSLSCVISVTLTMSVLYTKTINSYLCQFVGFLVILSCHCLMLSYTLIAFARFLTVISPFNKKIVSIHYIKVYLILKWSLAFLLSATSLIFHHQQITFQTKAKICTLKQQSPILLTYFCTGYIVPVILITLMNLVTYLNVIRARSTSSLTQTRLFCLNRRKRRNLRLLRQFSLFTIIFFLGWTPFILIEIFDKQEGLPDIIYLFALSLPSTCVFIDSNAMLYWNKTAHRQIRLWWRSLIKKVSID